jgi:hypothetical protein
VKNAASPGRSEFQRDIYAILLLMRRIDKKTPEDSSVYRLLEYYLKTYSYLHVAVGLRDYMNAIRNGCDVVTMISCWLRYAPAIPHNAKKDYDKIAPALLSA